MLAEAYSPENLRQVLLSSQRWHPYPAAGERKVWEALPAPLRQAHIARGEAAQSQPWPVLPATLFLEYARTGDRARCESASFARRTLLCDLVLAECLEGEGRFADAIADGVWALCEETYWGVPAHVGVQRAGKGLPDLAEPTVDLFAGETVALLAWTLYLVGAALDRVSPLLRARIHLEADRRILTPCLERDDFWWMGFGNRTVNNWNPWCNSNWLTAVLLLEQDESRRLAAVAKILRSLDRFVDPYPADGGCDEGPGYWSRAGASLFDCLELLHSATGGAIDLYDRPLIKEIGRYLYRVQIAGDYFINFADAPARVHLSAPLVFRYGRRIGDPHLAALGAWAAGQQDLLHCGVSDSIGRQLPALFLLPELLGVAATPPLPRDAWFPQIQVMAARDQEGSAAGFCLAAKGGHNAESHNHNDVGHFIVYTDGRPVIVDAGVETYTARTFSDRRYEIWTMQSAYHSPPTIGGLMQQPGRQFAAREVVCEATGQVARLCLDLAGAYPPEAQLRSWVRTIALHRGQQVELVDAYELSAPVPELTLSLLTPCQASASQAGVLDLEEREITEGRRSGSARLWYPADRLIASCEELPIQDRALQRFWGPRLTRVLLRAEKPPLQDTWVLQLTRE